MKSIISSVYQRGLQYPVWWDTREPLGHDVRAGAQYYIDSAVAQLIEDLIRMPVWHVVEENRHEPAIR